MTQPIRFPRERTGRPRPLLRTALGEVLRRARRQQGRTLADVAEAARVSMPYLSEVERGRKEVSSEVLAAICDALLLDLTDVLAEIRRGLVEARTGSTVSSIRVLADGRGGMPLETVRSRPLPSVGSQPAAPGRGDGEVLALAA